MYVHTVLWYIQSLGPWGAWPLLLLLLPYGYYGRFPCGGQDLYLPNGRPYRVPFLPQPFATPMSHLPQ